MVEADLVMGETEDLFEMVTIAKRGADHMLELINELLNISKLESGDMPIKPSKIDLPKIYQDTFERFKLVADQINLNFNANFDPGIQPLFADQELIRRMVYNLIDNAVKFSPDNGEIAVWSKPDPENDAYILFGVSDNGPGVTEEEKETIFLKYTSGHEKHARRQGTGLGLYFTRLAVEAHRGSVWVESDQKEGSTFIIRLPLNASSN